MSIIILLNSNLLAGTISGMGPLRQIFSTNLIEERRAAGVTQAELAKRTKISLSSIVKYESGSVWAGDAAAETIAKALGIPASRLYLDRGLIDAQVALDVLQKSLARKR